jgi:hypothetical protein
MQNTQSQIFATCKINNLHKQITNPPSILVYTRALSAFLWSPSIRLLSMYSALNVSWQQIEMVHKQNASFSASPAPMHLLKFVLGSRWKSRYIQPYDWNRQPDEPHWIRIGSSAASSVLFLEMFTSAGSSESKRDLEVRDDGTLIQCLTFGHHTSSKMKPRV